jgi:hypothetical protein
MTIWTELAEEYMHRPSVLEGLATQSEIGLLPIYAVQQVSSVVLMDEPEAAEEDGVEAVETAVALPVVVDETELAAADEEIAVDEAPSDEAAEEEALDPESMDEEPMDPEAADDEATTSASTIGDATDPDAIEDDATTAKLLATASVVIAAETLVAEALAISVARIEDRLAMTALLDTICISGCPHSPGILTAVGVVLVTFKVLRYLN